MEFDTLPPLPLTKDAIYRTAKLFGGMPHGDDFNGLVDVSFPTIFEAIPFASLWKDRTTVTLREPVSTLHDQVVIQVQS